MATIAPKARTRRLGPGSAGILLSPSEFDSADFVPHFRYELVQGVLIVTPPPGGGERNPNDELGYRLRLYGDTSPEGRALDLTLLEQTIATTPNRRRADRAIWVGLGRTPDLERDIPTIVIEIVSGRKRDYLRDYEVKAREYREVGGREYWIIDRFRRMMAVNRYGPDGGTTVIVAEPETYRTDLLPGFELPLARLLSRADAWDPPKRPRPETPPPAGGTS